jgi:hypothetical protein
VKQNGAIAPTGVHNVLFSEKQKLNFFSQIGFFFIDLDLITYNPVKMIYLCDGILSVKSNHLKIKPHECNQDCRQEET